MPRQQNKNNERYNDPFPSALRNLMRRDGTTQEQLKEVLGLKFRQSITGYCDGSTTPSLETIVKIADFFDVTTDYLLRGDPVDSRDPNIQQMCKYTGLSQHAVRAVAGVQVIDADPRFSMKASRINTLSHFVESDHFITLLSFLTRWERVVTGINDGSTVTLGPDVEAAAEFLKKCGYYVIGNDDKASLYRRDVEREFSKLLDSLEGDSHGILSNEDD